MRSQPTSSRSSHQIDSSIWKNIWGTRSTPKILNFLWRAFSNALPTFHNLHRRRLTRSSPLCHCHYWYLTPSARHFCKHRPLLNRAMKRGERGQLTTAKSQTSSTHCMIENCRCVLPGAAGLTGAFSPTAALINVKSDYEACLTQV